MGRILSKDFIEADTSSPKCGQLGKELEGGEPAPLEEPDIADQKNKFYF